MASAIRSPRSPANRLANGSRKTASQRAVSEIFRIRGSVWLMPHTYKRKASEKVTGLCCRQQAAKGALRARHIHELNSLLSCLSVLDLSKLSAVMQECFCKQSQ